MKSLPGYLVLLACLACAPRDPYGGQAATTPTAEDHRIAGCKQNVNTMLGTYCANPPSPLPPGYAESVRRGYDSQKASCPADILAPLDDCARRLEAIAVKEDPDAKTRREAAAPKAEATKKDPRFTSLIDEWLATLDRMKIMCRQSDASDSHRRECERYRDDLAGVEKRLRALLVDELGFDPRDLGELGLWPGDPNPYE